MNSPTSTAATSFAPTHRSWHASPRLKARAAGMLYLIAVLTAVFAEFLAPGKLGDAIAVAVPVSCYAAVTLLLFSLFKSVHKNLALLMAVIGLIGLAFEAMQLQPGGINVGMTCHALFCLFLALLIFKSTLLPRIFAASMFLAGLVWLIYLSPPLAKFVSPWNSAVGLLAEALPMLWLLIMGVNRQERAPEV